MKKFKIRVIAIIMAAVILAVNIPVNTICNVYYLMGSAGEMLSVLFSEDETATSGDAASSEGTESEDIADAYSYISDEMADELSSENQLLGSASLLATSYSANTGTTWSSVFNWAKTNLPAGSKMACATYVSRILMYNTGFYSGSFSETSSCYTSSNSIYKQCVANGYTNTGYYNPRSDYATGKSASYMLSQTIDCIEENAEKGDILLFYGWGYVKGTTDTLGFGHTGIYNGVYNGYCTMLDSSGENNGVRSSVYSNSRYIYYVLESMYENQSLESGGFGVYILHPDSTEYGYLRLRKWSVDSSSTSADGANGAVFTIYKVSKNKGTSTKKKVATAKIGGKNYIVNNTDPAKFAVGNGKKSGWTIESAWSSKGVTAVKGTAKLVSLAQDNSTDYGADGYEELLKLPAGWYRIEETTTPSGYTAADTVWVEITGDDTVNDPEKVVRKNTKTEDINLTVNKSGNVSGVNTDYYNMAGIQYYVYSDSSCSTVATSTNYATSGNNASYRIVLSWDGYAYADSNGRNVVFNSESEKNAYENSGGNVSIYYWYKKLDSGDTSTSKTYYVKESNVILARVSTWNDNSGPYWYGHDNAAGWTPYGNNGNSSYAVSVTGYTQNTSTITAVCNVGSLTVKSTSDNIVRGCLKLIKTSTVDTSYLDSTYYDMEYATYSIYDESDNEVGYYTIRWGYDSNGNLCYTGVPYATSYGTSIGVVATANTSSRSVVNTANNYFSLPLGTYTIKETEAPNKGYTANSDSWTLVVDTNTSGSVIETLKKGSTIIWNETTSIYSVVIGNGKGNTTSGGTDSNNVTANVNADTPTFGLLWINKTYSGGTASELGGLKFYLYKASDSKGTYSESDKVATYTYGSGWSIESIYSTRYGMTASGRYISSVPFGYYVLVEDEAIAKAKGFVPAENVCKHITVSGSAYEFAMDNLRSGLQLNKEYEDVEYGSMTNYSLVGAEYVVYTTDGEGTVPVDEENEYIASQYVCTFTTDENGKGVVTDVGTYEVDGKTYSYEISSDGYIVKGLAIDSWVYVKETVSSPGCELDETEYYKYISDENAITVTSIEPVCLTPLAIHIQKQDYYTGDTKATGSGSLAGAEFTISYYDVNTDEITTYDDLVNADISPDRVWVFATKENDEGGGYLDTASEEYFVSGDEFYYYDGVAVIPQGIITIKETKASEGYTLEGAFFAGTDSEGNALQVSNESGVVFVPVTNRNTENTTIYMDGTNESLDLDKEEITNRADIKFVKLDVRNNSVMAGVAFKLTSATTGESHILVTDENGVIDTSNPVHSENTNANDAADDSSYASCGIWFYGNCEHTGIVDDEAGALPYDTYVLSEIDTDKNDGYVLTDDVTITINDDTLYEDGYYYLDLGSITNVPEPDIGTTVSVISMELSDESSEGIDTTVTDERILPVGVIAELSDVVSYSYFTAGKTYTVKGIIMDAETGLPYTDSDGNYITGMYTFTLEEGYELFPEEKCGTVNVSFSIDTTGLNGKSLVVYEYVFEGESTDELVVNEDGSIDESGAYTTNTGKVVKHTDLTDENQTIKIYAPDAVKDKMITYETTETTKDTTTKVTKTTETTETTNTNTPKTGDDYSPFAIAIIFVIAVAAATTLIIIKRKKFKSLE